MRLRGKILFLAVLLGVFVVSLYWFYCEQLSADYYPFKKVEVNADFSQLNAAKVESLILPNIEKGFFHSDLFSLEKKLTSLAWVKKATATRAWPWRLTINLQTQQAMALWGDDGVFNKDGELFYPERTLNLETLPQLTGPDKFDHQVLSEFVQMKRTLKTYKLQIVALNVSSQFGRTLTLSNGLSLYLGRREVDLRLNRFLKVYSSSFHDKLNAIAYIDLRYPHGMAVKWKQSLHTDV